MGLIPLPEDEGSKGICPKLLCQRLFVEVEQF